MPNTDTAQAIVDSLAPAALGATTIAPLALPLRMTDTGTDSSDDLTSDNQMMVSGVEAAAHWEYWVAGGDWQAGSGSSFEVTDDDYGDRAIQAQTRW